MTTATPRNPWFDLFCAQWDAATKPVTQSAPPVTKPAPWDTMPTAGGGDDVAKPAPVMTKPVAQPAPMTTATVTCACGAVIRQNWNGRPRRHCSAACRQRAYRRRKRQPSEVDP